MAEIKIDRAEDKEKTIEETAQAQENPQQPSGQTNQEGEPEKEASGEEKSGGEAAGQEEAEQEPAGTETEADQAAGEESGEKASEGGQEQEKKPAAKPAPKPPASKSGASPKGGAKKKKPAPKKPRAESSAEETLIFVTQAQWDELSARADKAGEYLETAQRLQAEFENYRKRNLSVRQDARCEGTAEVVLEILPVLDNLQRAVESVQEDENGLLEGVRMVQRQFIEILGRLGIEEIPAEAGASFDPKVHEAVMQVPAQEDQKSGQIAQVLLKGYKMGAKVLRATMVSVVQ
ncbi:MAG: nucleotide exchange factor GrpE [Christensenellales bacterium]|jgi:molecular chaperone GrpE